MRSAASARLVILEAVGCALWCDGVAYETPGGFRGLKGTHLALHTRCLLLCLSGKDSVCSNDSLLFRCVDVPIGPHLLRVASGRDDESFASLTLGISLVSWPPMSAWFLLCAHFVSVPGPCDVIILRVEQTDAGDVTLVEVTERETVERYEQLAASGAMDRVLQPYQCAPSAAASVPSHATQAAAAVTEEPQVGAGGRADRQAMLTDGGVVVFVNCKPQMCVSRMLSFVSLCVCFLIV